MATTDMKGSRRKLPTAAIASIPTAAAHAAEPMTAAEAAPALEAAHAASDIAAAPLLASEDMSAAPVTLATPSPKPDVDPAPADTAAVTAATEDHIMGVNDTINNSVDQGQAQAKAMFTDMTDRTKGAVEKSQKFFAELAEFNKGTVEALVESSRIATRGIETMCQDAAAYARTSFEGATQAMRALAAVKSPTDFMTLQADFARSAFDAMIAQASRGTEASLKLAGEVAQPISNRVALAADKMKIAA